MGIYVGDAPITADTVYSIYHTTERHPDLRWTIGHEAWYQIRRLKHADGQYLWNVYGAQDPITLLGYPVDISDTEPTALRLGAPKPATGATERLMVPCRACGGAYPAGAVYCIECGTLAHAH